MRLEIRDRLRIVALGMMTYSFKLKKQKEITKKEGDSNLLKNKYKEAVY